jgi:hypothetical protein
MKKMKLFCILAGSILACQSTFSQSLAVNTDGSTANPSAILDIKSTTKGMLVPRMLKSERTAISSPATGLIVYQTGPDSTGQYIYNGSSWEWVQTTANASSSSDWKLVGNGSTNPSNNFIGTTDNVALRFRVFDTWSGQIDNSGNTSFGKNAGQSNGSGTNNTGIGSGALQNTTSGINNTAIGTNALLANISGSNNTAIGYGATTGATLSNATAIGYNASVTQSNSIVFGNGGANVGIGTTAPQYLLHVAGTATFMKGANTHTGFFYNATSNVDGIEWVALGTNDAFGSIQRGDNGYCLHLGKGNSSVNQGILGFYVNGSDIGHVDCNVAGTSVTYYTTSDERLKENIRTTRYGLDNLMKIRVADYNYKSDVKKAEETGFLAQQLYQFYPQAVKPGGEDPKTNPWTVDYGRLTPILVKAVQEQQLIIQSQNARISNEENEIRKLKEKVEQLMKAMGSK